MDLAYFYQYVLESVWRHDSRKRSTDTFRKREERSHLLSPSLNMHFEDTSPDLHKSLHTCCRYFAPPPRFDKQMMETALLSNASLWYGACRVVVDSTSGLLCLTVIIGWLNIPDGWHGRGWVTSVGREKHINLPPHFPDFLSLWKEQFAWLPLMLAGCRFLPCKRRLATLCTLQVGLVYSLQTGWWKHARFSLSFISVC